MKLTLDIQALEVALRAGLIPAEVAVCPVVGLRVGQTVSLEVDAAVGELLIQLGATSGEPMCEQMSGQRYQRWFELISPSPTPEPRPPFGQLLWALPAPRLLQLAAELLRLGCDRQSLALVDDTGLLLATDPPLYTVLKTLHEEGETRVYRSTHPGIWQQLGWRHPLADATAVPAESMLLIGAPEISWRLIADGPWRDLGAQVELIIPEAHPLVAANPVPQLQVLLGLGRAPRRRPPSLWFVRDEAVEQVQRLVETVPLTIVESLLFAVIETTPPWVIIQVRADGLSLPELPLQGVAMAPLPAVPNLYLPVEQVFEPPMRPSWLRTQLASDPDALVFVDAPKGVIRVAHLPVTAMRPLTAWVDYRIDIDREALQIWVDSAMFQMDRYVSIGCEWEDGPRGRPAARDWGSPAEPELEPEQEQEPGTEPEQEPELEPEPALEADLPPETTPPAASEPAEPLDSSDDEAQKALRLLERQALILGDATAAEYADLWAALAEKNHALGRAEQAHLCWSRAAWADPEGAREPPAMVAELGATDSRQMAVEAIARGVSAKQTPRLTALLDTCASTFDLRTLWMARQALAAQADDQLGRLRTRDLIFERLKGGLSMARNVPLFVSHDGATGRADLLLALEQIFESALSTPRKRSAIEAGLRETEAYIRLAFACGLARLGGSDRAEAEGLTAQGQLNLEDPVHGWAAAAYRTRISQAIEGLPPWALLPASLSARRDGLARFDRYKVDRLRQASRLLDPSDSADPFAAWQADEGSIHGPRFDGLSALEQPNLESALCQILDDSSPADGEAGPLLGVLAHLELLEELPAVGLLERVIERAAVLSAERALQPLSTAAALAVGFERPDLFGAVLERFEAVVSAPSGAAPAQMARTAQILGALSPLARSAGFEASFVRLLSAVEGRLKGGDLVAARARLHLSAARVALAMGPAVDSGFELAFKAAFETVVHHLGAQRPAARLALVREIALALSQTTPRLAIAGVEILMRGYPEVSDTFNTNSHFCVSVVHFVESMVLALASETLALSPAARRWLDRDEHLLRQRIHRDLRSRR